jgi:PIN domain nuclease of toxin-antitoxin system
MPITYQNDKYVADAHALVWHITDDKRLGEEARAILTQADQALALVYVPTIVLAEIMYLAERGRIKVAFSDVLTAVRDSAGYLTYPFDESVLERAAEARNIPELFDRIIVATAILTGATTITKDEAITTAQIVKTVW